MTLTYPAGERAVLLPANVQQRWSGHCRDEEFADHSFRGFDPSHGLDSEPVWLGVDNLYSADPHPGLRELSIALAAVATPREQGVLVGRPGRGVFVAESRQL